MKRMNSLVRWITLMAVWMGLMGGPSVLANHNPPQGPAEFNGLKFKKQDMKDAKDKLKKKRAHQKAKRKAAHDKMKEEKKEMKEEQK